MLSHLNSSFLMSVLLVQLAQTEGGKSEVSCAIDYDNPVFVKVVPMVHTDASRPSDFAFANHVSMQTDDSEDEDMPTVPAELRQTINNHLWLTTLEVSAAITPTLPVQPFFPRHPHPDRPTHMTKKQLLHAQLKLDQAHQQRDISKMLKGIVTNMHCLAKLLGWAPPGGPSFFAGTLTRELRHSLGEKAHALALYVDDAVIGGAPEDLQELLRRLPDKLLAAGLQMAGHKTQVWSSQGASCVPFSHYNREA